MSTLPTTLSLPSDQDSTGRTLGEEEIALVSQALRSGTLTSTKGEFTKRFETGFAEQLGCKFGHACSSGSASLHVAIGVVDPEPGDEIVTTSITDMGAITPILFQGAIPVFADVDPDTYNVTAETIEAVLSERTKAIMVTHLFGNPCLMGPIMELARSRGIPVIEDCAQAFHAEIGGQAIGTIGDIGCFSLQQGKHITTGEGGIVVTNNEELARRAFLLINKAWGYGDENPDHYFSALNYRMTELQGAVACAQLEKLPGVVDARCRTAAELSEKLQGTPGLGLPKIADDARHTYWKYCVNVDDSIIDGGAVGLGAKLREKGIMSAPRYIQKPAFRCKVIAEQRTLGDSRWPFTLAREEALDYSEERFPGTFKALSQVLVLPWNEAYTEEHVDFVASSLKDAVQALSI